MPRLQAGLIAFILAVCAIAVGTYEAPREVAIPKGIDLWGALAAARSARMTLTYGADPAVDETATGTIDVAAQRSSARVDVTGQARGTYEQVVDRSAVYVRRDGGAWYRYLVVSGAPTRAFELLTALTRADPLRRAGESTVRGDAVTRYLAGGVAGLVVYVDGSGFPRRLEHRAGPPGQPVARLELYDFLQGDAIVVPARFTAVAGLDEALRKAGAA